MARTRGGRARARWRKRRRRKTRRQRRKKDFSPSQGSNFCVFVCAHWDGTRTAFFETVTEKINEGKKNGKKRCSLNKLKEKMYKFYVMMSLKLSSGCMQYSLTAELPLDKRGDERQERIVTMKWTMSSDEVSPQYPSRRISCWVFRLHCFVFL